MKQILIGLLFTFTVCGWLCVSQPEAQSAGAGWKKAGSNTIAGSVEGSVAFADSAAVSHRADSALAYTHPDPFTIGVVTITDSLSLETGSDIKTAYTSPKDTAFVVNTQLRVMGEARLDTTYFGNCAEDGSGYTFKPLNPAAPVSPCGYALWRDGPTTNDTLRIGTGWKSGAYLDGYDLVFMPADTDVDGAGVAPLIHLQTGASGGIGLGVHNPQRSLDVAATDIQLGRRSQFEKDTNRRFDMTFYGYGSTGWPTVQSHVMRWKQVGSIAGTDSTAWLEEAIASTTSPNDSYAHVYFKRNRNANDGHVAWWDHFGNYVMIRDGVSFDYTTPNNNKGRALLDVRSDAATDSSLYVGWTFGNLVLGDSLDAESTAHHAVVFSGGGSPSTTGTTAFMWGEKLGAGDLEIYTLDSGGEKKTISANVQVYPDDMGTSITRPYVSMTENIRTNKRTYIAEHKALELLQEMAWESGKLPRDKYLIKHVDRFSPGKVLRAGPIEAGPPRTLWERLTD